MNSQIRYIGQDKTRLASVGIGVLFQISMGHAMMIRQMLF